MNNLYLLYLVHMWQIHGVFTSDLCVIVTQHDILNQFIELEDEFWEKNPVIDQQTIPK